MQHPTLALPTTDAGFTPRATCARCERPVSACYCKHVVPIETRTKLVLLQHPREEDVAIGTAKMASLSLTNSRLYVGTDWEDSTELKAALSDPACPAVLLYPGADAIDVTLNPPTGPVTLVVVDGTWSQTKKVVKRNPILSSLPRYAFVPPKPSEYRIRREPKETYVATIEAIMHVLTALEGKEEQFSQLMAPFRAMIDFQLDCEKNLQSHRKRVPRVRTSSIGNAVPAVFLERTADLVCITAEANAWPFAIRKDHPEFDEELIQWSAHRPSTGETLTFVVKPERKLAPGTLIHTCLSEETLQQGGSLGELVSKWRAFTRETDVLCSWGHYERSLFLRTLSQVTGEERPLPQQHVDLRQVIKNLSRGKVGLLESYLEKTGLADELLQGELANVPGRGGKRLRGVASVVQRLITSPTSLRPALRRKDFSSVRGSPSLPEPVRSPA